MKKSFVILLIIGIILLNTPRFVNADLATDLTSYWKLDESSGTNAVDSIGSLDITMQNIEDADWTAGLINNGIDLDDNLEWGSIPDNCFPSTGAFSVSLWFDPDDFDVDSSIIDFRGDRNLVFQVTTEKNFQYFAGSGWVDTTADAYTGWQHIVIVYDGSRLLFYHNDTLFYNETYSIGTSSTANALGSQSTGSAPIDGMIDEVGVWNRPLSPTEVTDLYNSGGGLTYPFFTYNIVTNLILPLNDSKESGDYIFFNATAEPTLANLTNATIRIWDSTWNLINLTTNLFSGETINSTTWNISNFSIGERYYWNVESCGTNSSLDVLCDSANINLTFVSSAFSENNYIFNTSVFETTRQGYILNITGNSLISSATASLWYNGTSYTSTVTSMVAGYYKATNNLDVPLTPQNDNKEFLWEWSFVLTDGSLIKQNSTVYEQEVNRTWFTICNATFDEQFINFTIRDATNPFPLMNATFKAAWDFWLGEGDIKRNYSFEDVTETKHNFDFCMFPEDESFYLNGQLEFDATDYSQNYYYLDNAILTNTTNAIDLYLLNDSLATLTILQVYNEAQEAISNVTIKIQLYDVGTDTYYTIGMAKTSFAGEDVVYLNWYDSLYKFILTLNGEVIKTTTPYKISETPQIFEITTATSFIYDKFEDFVYNLYYNNVTKNFVLTFTKPSGLVDKGCLRVIKRNVINDTQICLVCETSSSATLYCNIAGQGNGTYIATFYATGSLKTFDTIVEFIEEINKIYDEIGNTDGSVYALLFAGVIVAMFFVSPVIAIIGVLLGILGSIALEFQPVNYIEFIGIVLIGGTIIWILKR